MIGSKILIVGCGQLGSRHLQAVASLENVSQIDVVDSNSSAIDIAKTRLTEVTEAKDNIQYQWFSDLSQSKGLGDLCVIATQSKVRPKLIKQVYQQLGYKKFFIEKIVCQSIKEYQELMLFCSKNKLLVWVNCKSRTYLIHKYIRARLNPNYPILFSKFGGNHGLANNGIHSADLFIFYDQSKSINGLHSRIDDILHPSKRGNDIYDLSGELFGYSQKGSRFILSFAGDYMGPDRITIDSSQSRFIVDHFLKFAYESYADNGWEWQKIIMDEEWRVSHMSKKFISDILLESKSDLPTLEECFGAHQFILGQLQPHFNRLLKTDNNYCPVT